jgi:hypothetical protein
MAIITIQDAINRALTRHPSISPTEAIQFATEVYRELIQAADVGRASVNVNVTDGVHNYLLPTSIYGVIDAEYRRSATETTRLMQVPEDKLAEYISTYRTLHEKGDPIYISAVQADNGTGIVTQFRLYPTPSVTTSGGFPIVTLHVTRQPSVITGSTPIPDRLANADVFVEGIWAKYARLYRDEDFPMLEQRYQKAMDDAITSLRGIFRNESHQMVPDVIVRWPRLS